MGGYFPDFLLYKNKSQFAKNNILKSNKLIKYNGNNINKNINTSINKKNTQYNKKDNSVNYIYNNMKMKVNNSHIISKKAKNPESKSNNNKNKATNFSYLNNPNWHIFINKNIKNKASNFINTYKNNILNSSEKDCISSIISDSKPEENFQKIDKDYENEINILKKEKEESEQIVKQQEKLIKKIEEDIQKLTNKIKNIKNENQKIYNKIETYKENEDQLIMLVKIIQKSGVDVEDLIDKWNSEIDNEENNNNIKEKYNNDESITDSINELNSKNSKITPASFIPINIEDSLNNKNKNIYKGIPKLNFDKINEKKQNQRKEKFRNNSK